MGKTGIRESSNQLSISITLGDEGSGDHRSYWGVVDERSGRGEDFSGSSDDSGVSISRPLAKVVSTISKTVISDCNRDGMGGNLGGNFTGGLNNTFHNWDMGDSSNRGQRDTSQRKTS